MEKKDSIEKEPVGSSVPEDVKKVEEDHNKDTPIIKNDVSGNEMVGPTNEEILENKHVIHEEHHQEPSTTKDLSDNEVDETAADNEEIESSSKITSQEENMSTDNTTSSSSNSENPISNPTDKPDIQKEDQEKGNSVNNPTTSSTSSDIDIRNQKEEHSINAPIKVELSGDEMVGPTNEEILEKKHEEHQDREPSTTKHLSDNDHKIEASSNIHLVDDANDMEIRSQEDNMSTDNSNTTSSSSNSENSINAVTSVPDIKKEDQEKGNSVNNTTITSTTSDLDIRSQKEEHSTNNNLENSVNTLTSVPGIKKEDKEKGNSVNDTTTSSTSSDIEKTGQEEEHSTNNSLSNSDNSINNPTDKPDIKKEDREKGISVNNTTTDLDIRSQEEEHSTINSLSNSDNSINNPTDKPDIQKEDQEKGISVNDTTLNSIAKEGEILDSETVKVNHQPSEKMEIKTDRIQEKSKNVKRVIFSEDVEKIFYDLNDNQDSSSQETGDKKTESKDNNTSSKKEEEALVVYGTQQPIMGPAKPSVLTKFAQLKNLYTSSNVFSRLSKNNDLQNNEKNNNINENSQTTQTKNQENKKKSSLKSLEPIPIKGRVVLYTKLWCQDCKKTRLFLKKKRLVYSEINIDVYPGRKMELEKLTGSSDVPIVFFNQDLIGGLKEIKGLDESGNLDEKIELLTSQGPSPEGPLPPFSGEDDECFKGTVDELAVIVNKMKESIDVKDRFYKFRRVTNCFMGSEAVDFLSQDQFLEREEAVEFARKLAKELFFRHVLEENTFEDGNQHLYSFLDQDPAIRQCQNIPRGIIQSKRQPLVQLSHRLRFLLYAILEAYISEDGRRVAYRTIHGSEEFARFLRIVEELQRVDLNRTTKEEKLAFFINLYNLMTIHAILVWGHPEGALDRRKLFNEFKYVIGGCAYSLSDIYNGILRANQRPPYTLIKPFGIYDKRFKVSLAYPEPLVHFALVSGNRSAPALRCYSPENIDVELMEAARDFLQSGAFVVHLDSMTTVSATKILKWYSIDFGKKEIEVLKHAANYLEVGKTQNLLELADSSLLKVVYQPYDWRLNS